MTVLRITLLLLFPIGTWAQGTFLKTYPSPDGGYEALKDMISLPAGQCAFITNGRLCKTDASGNLVLQTEIRTGQSTYLESLQKDGAGNYYIAGHATNAAGQLNLQVWKVNPNGQVIWSKSIEALSTNKLQLLPAGNNRFFACYLHRLPNDETHIDVLLLDEQGNLIWKKELPRQLFNRFVAQTLPNGNLALSFLEAGTYQNWLIQLNTTGTVTEVEIQIPPISDYVHFIADFAGTPDGGYIFAGESMPSQGLSDALLFKTAGNGKITWLLRSNISRADQITSIGLAPDGYYFLGNTGHTDNWDDDVAGDIVLLKTNLQGQLQWKKAFGSTRKDYSTRLLMGADHLLIGGRVSYPGQTTPITMLCKTDLQGNLDTYPAPSATAPQLHLQVPVAATVQEMVKIFPIDGSDWIGSGNFHQQTNDTTFPYIFRTNQSGTPVWHKRLSADPGIVRATAAAPDGNFTAVVEQPNFLTTNSFQVIKFTRHGDILWSSEVYTSVIRHILATRDGGYLLTGGEDETLSDFDLILIKLDAQGREVWRKKTGSTTHWEVGRSAVETPDGHFIIAGNRQLAFDDPSQAYVAKADARGNILWTKTYSPANTVDVLTDVVITTNQEYVLTGSSSMGTFDKRDVLVIRLNQQGDQLWQKTFDLYQQDRGLSVRLAANDTILIGGTTGEPIVGKLERYGFLLKLDQSGKQAGVQYYGKEGIQTSIEHLYVADDAVWVAGNTQVAYGNGHIFMAKANSVYPPLGPVLPDGLLLYPNPARYRTNISIRNNYTGPVNISLYNSVGQKIWTQVYTKNDNSFQAALPLTSLSAGIYYLWIRQGNERTVKKLKVLSAH